MSPLVPGGEPLRKIVLANRAIATSGDLWQYVMIDGERRSHILDPTTGVGVLGPVAATVIAPSATGADALATAACILDWPEVNKLVETQSERDLPEDYQVLVARKNVQDDLILRTSSGFPER